MAGRVKNTGRKNIQGCYGDRTEGTRFSQSERSNENPGLRRHQMAKIQKGHLPPHLELLPQLQVHVVHLGDGNVVVLSLLLAQQLVPGTLKTWED